MTSLAVFDIDGTLTDTTAVDNACFLRAVSEVLGVDVAHVDWSTAPHVTDSALLVWLAGQHGKLPVSDRTANLVVDRFLELLEAERLRSADRFRPVAGATQLFAALAHAGWSCALATGGWQRSARLKLAAAGLDADALVMASSNDASTRIEIIQIAALRAQGNGAAFTRIVSIGDAVWDIHAAAALQWSFIGVAVGTAVTTLRLNGATTIVADFTDFPAFLAALDSAELPRVHPETGVTPSEVEGPAPRSTRLVQIPRLRSG